MRAHRLRIAAALALELVAAAPALAQRLDGFNVVAAPGHPFGSASAAHSLAAAKGAGARAVAIVPFLWQPAIASAAIVRGDDMPDDELRAAIRTAHALSLSAIVKPQVWVPGSWAGAVAPASEPDWQTWFENYRDALLHIAEISAQEHAEALAIGTELVKTSQRPEWPGIIAAVREKFSGTLFYVAHDADEAEAVPFWDRLDAIGVSLYPPLGADWDGPGRLATMRATAARLDTLSARMNKPVIVGEIGLRSAKGAAAKPWESAEERIALPAPRLQAAVLADWLAVLDRPAIHGVLIWRWFTDPMAGGPADTDFTVQGKQAEDVVRCAWTARCVD